MNSTHEMVAQIIRDQATFALYNPSDAGPWEVDAARQILDELHRVSAPSSDKVLLRDWFAGQALIGYLAAHANPSATASPDATLTAKNAFLYADAMLAERER